ncbi:MAG: hypothetical protein J6O90_03730, partial [Candidatus Methanomethylophilaceae archaeon]|nr:hypothetical protein [Candidatus Methanomethylophilaceae archaeon]
MNDKDERLNKRLIEGSSILVSCLNAPDFIDPADIEGTLDEFKPLREDAKSRSKKILYKMGLANRDLKEDLQAFVSRYDS